MVELLWDVWKDTVVDGVKMLPFLFAAYLLIEYVEHKSAGGWKKRSEDLEGSAL